MTGAFPGPLDIYDLFFCSSSSLQYPRQKPNISMRQSSTTEFGTLFKKVVTIDIVTIGYIYLLLGVGAVTCLDALLLNI